MTEHDSEDWERQTIGNYLGWFFLTAFSVLSLGGIIAGELRIPIGEIAPVLYVVAIGMPLILVVPPERMRIDQNSLVAVFLSALIVFWSIGSFFGDGIFNTLGPAHPDSWNHITRGLYLWHYSRGETGDLAPIFQYASHLSETRWGSSSLLAVLSLLTIPGDPSASLGLFFILAVLATYFGFCCLGREIPMIGVHSPYFAAFAIALGWTVAMLDVGNYENFLFVVYTPTIISILIRAKRMRLGWREATILGVMIVNSAAGYPEGFAILVVILFPLGVALFVPRGGTQTFAGFYLPLLLALLIFGSSSVFRSISHIIMQLSSVSVEQPANVMRAGETLFTQLLGPGFAHSFFAISPAGKEASYWGYLTIGYTILIPAVVFGCVVLWRYQKSIIASFACIVVLLVWQGFVSKYSYGLYKISNISHPIWILLLYLGLREGVKKISYNWLRFEDRYLNLGLFLLCIGIAIVAKFSYSQPVTFKRDGFEDLSDIKIPNVENGVYLDVRSDFEHLWAVYFLRDKKIICDQWRSYINQPHLKEHMEKAIRPNGTGFPVLSLAPKENMLWSNGQFALTKPKDISLKGVDNPNGLETIDGLDFIWVSNKPTLFYIESNISGSIRLFGTRMFIGPSASERPKITINVQDVNGSRLEDFSNDTISINFTIEKGTNAVGLRVVDEPSTTAFSNGDNRALMLGILGYEFELHQNK